MEAVDSNSPQRAASRNPSVAPTQTLARADGVESRQQTHERDLGNLLGGLDPRGEGVAHEHLTGHQRDVPRRQRLMASPALVKNVADN